MTTPSSSTNHRDVLIIGAGLSGIAAAYHLQDKCPDKSYAVIEGRKNTGGTWDLFKYPGIRSDSDMYTLGFSFYPWKNPKAIADGPAIFDYIKETAEHFGIDRHIQFESKALTADWSSETKKWTLTIHRADTGEIEEMTCNFLFSCCGYYNYEQGYMPQYNGVDNYQGRLIHPQHWDTSMDYTDKNIVVIGSGATAVTLVPELAKKARQVTMLQRSPTYIMSIPSEDLLVNFARKILPEKTVYSFARWKNIRLSIFQYWWARNYPNTFRKMIAKGVKANLGKDYDMKNFDPQYAPWDQRLCVVPDGDLFESIKGGKSTIVTDTIKTFTKDGILLTSGEELKADIVVSATGLNVQLFGGISASIDGHPVDPSQHYVYRGAMINDIPNFGFAVGYTNASWTLKCDLTAQYIAKIIGHMTQHNHTTVTPRFDTERYSAERLMDFDAGYIKRVEDQLPKQGSGEPWKVHQHYLRDKKSIGQAPMTDEHLEYR